MLKHTTIWAKPTQDCISIARLLGNIDKQPSSNLVMLMPICITIWELGSLSLPSMTKPSVLFPSRWRLIRKTYGANDALKEAREGVKRIRAGKKHQEDLLKKEKADELKKGEGGAAPQ